MSKEIHVTNTETAAGWLNKFAREASEDRRYPEDYEYDQVLSLADRVVEETLDRATVFREDTLLSDTEATVVALKEIGLTHAGISLTLSIGPNGTADRELASSSPATSTVDEYARRAREKYLAGQRTHLILDSVFGEALDPIESPHHDRPLVTIGETTIPASQYVGLDESAPDALNDDEVFVTFDPDELLEEHPAGALSLLSSSDEEITTPDGEFTGRVVDVGVGGGGNIGLFIERTG